jgi:hypothetical protein
LRGGLNKIKEYICEKQREGNKGMSVERKKKKGIQQKRKG